jgi:hypothetical protein
MEIGKPHNDSTLIGSAQAHAVGSSAPRGFGWSDQPHAQALASCNAAGRRSSVAT